VTAEPDELKARARRAAQQFGRNVLPAVAFDDPDLFFDLAIRRHDQALLAMLTRIDPNVRVPGHARFLGRFALAGGTWRHLASDQFAAPHEWEATGVALPMSLDGDGPYAVVARKSDAVRYFVSLPATEGTGHVLAERYADPKDHRPESAPTRTRSHRAIVRPGFLSFVATVAEVLANSTSPPASGARTDRLPRPTRKERAWFAHVVLRDFVFEGGARQFDTWAEPAANELIVRQWVTANGRRTLDDAPRVAGRWVADTLGLWPLEDELASPDAWELVVVAFPNVPDRGEPWACAIACRRRPIGVRYFTGDRTFDGAEGLVRNMLTEWRGAPFAQPVPRIMAPWPGEPSPEALAEAVRDRLFAPVETSG
jgi:hypothetical protein